MQSVDEIRTQIQETKQVLKELQKQARSMHQRVVDLNWKKTKYHTDPEFKEKVKARCLAIYYRKKAAAAAAAAAQV
jgi:hypothetical protein